MTASPPNTLPPDAGPVLTALARAAIVGGLGGTREPAPAPARWARELGASFVTLTARGHLRGCIGTLEAFRALDDDVRSNAVAAAFRDPRFRPVGPDEVDGLHVEVSVLSAPEPMAVSSRAEALEQLRPGVDGVILQAGSQRATFLPQVWQDLPTPAVFVAHLLAKAGLPADYAGELTLSRYTVTAFHEAG
ncbi:MAG: AmmeMemoRadiSam system protein A [Bifidobacteriaceae bacterium]|jgi:AmmeMemoRadiSam system protein A|nr:AmmeMemoRadiSam system protein A [Bifidobacteriaceae bacterium]